MENLEKEQIKGDKYDVSNKQAITKNWDINIKIWKI